MHVTYWINSSYPELRQSKATLPRNVSVFTIRTGINIQEMARDKYYRITLAWCAGVRRRKFLFLIRRQNSLMRKQKIKQAKKRNEKKVVKETKKTRTDDAAFLVDLLLLPRWKRAMSLVSSMKDNPKIFFFKQCVTSTKCRLRTYMRCTIEKEVDHSPFSNFYVYNRWLCRVRPTCL